MHNFDDLASKFQSVTLSKDKQGNDILNIYAYPIAGKFTKFQKFGFVISAFVVFLVVCFRELNIHTEFPHLGYANWAIFILFLVLFITIACVLFTNSVFEIRSKFLKFKTVSFKRITIDDRKVNLDEVEKFICELRYEGDFGDHDEISSNDTYSRKSTRREILEIVYRNGKKVRLYYRFDWDVGLAMIDLIQSFLGLEEKVMISKYHYELYNKKSISDS